MKHPVVLGGMVWLILGIAAVPTATLADDPSDQLMQQRARLQAERDAIEQAHSLRVQACWQRFAVNDCLREARRARHAALDPLRAQELELNAQERAWRTQQREERLRGKQSSGQEQRP